MSVVNTVLCLIWLTWFGATVMRGLRSYVLALTHAYEDRTAAIREGFFQ